MRFLLQGLGFSTRECGFPRSIVLLFLCLAMMVNSCELRPLTDPDEYEQEEKSGEDSSDGSSEDSSDESDSEGNGGGVDVEWGQGPEFSGEL